MNRKIKAAISENEEFEKKLTEENRKIMTDIVCYIRSFPVSVIEQEQVRMDIAVMLYDGQNRGEDAQQIIGGDYKRFCDELIAEIPVMKKNVRAAVSLGNLCLYTAIASVIVFAESILRALIKGDQIWPVVSAGAGSLVQMAAVIAVAVVIVEFIMKNSFETAGRKEKIIFAALIVLCFVAAAAGRIFLDDFTADISVVMWIIVTIILFMVHKAVEYFFE